MLPVDKLGVTGSSPVAHARKPPANEAVVQTLALRGFVVWGAAVGLEPDVRVPEVWFPLGSVPKAQRLGREVEPLGKPQP